MANTTALLFFSLAAFAACSPSTCTFIPSTNATTTNYPGSSFIKTSAYPYNISVLSEVPIATICTSPTGNRTAELACARIYIDAIDEQLAFLYARRLGYAAVAGASKFATNTSLNDPSRNDVVAAGMAAKVLKYGATEAAGAVMGGEGCMIYAALKYEVETIQEECNNKFTVDVERVCK
ncbi:hypothetical protein DPSP01_001618 [Paraphaeosphaeria sporulosa]|uniref:Chorismate mutase domain-containing protein n=1 Tax=Paraphaeosphaeria sporulosa TaxID=1460663 RepID=A0A177CTJ9_9PLEO|nr:uncharacterized protein CC84DRAFT_461621 [Paraphaeosphaeria sporulosa]OAG10079.1 hypothetical protein CC84DRAFT_461621 [Paraphaeosphaeria sporulosa]